MSQAMHVTEYQPIGREPLLAMAELCGIASQQYRLFKRIGAVKPGDGLIDMRAIRSQQQHFASLSEAITNNLTESLKQYPTTRTHLEPKK